MCYLILTLWLICELISLAFSVPVSLAWDAVPQADTYRVWRGIEVLAVSTAPGATVDLLEGEGSDLRVTAVNAAGESPPSAPITVYLPPGLILAPAASTHVRLVIRASDDLRGWASISTLDLTETSPRRFYQLTIEH